MNSLNHFFLEQHINIVNRVTLQSFGLSVAAYPTLKEKIVVIYICIHYQTTPLYSPILTPEGSNVRRVYLVVSS